MKTRITRNELAEWIRDTSKDSLMLTISEPHAKAHHLTLELWVSPIFTDTFIKLVKIEGNVRDGNNGIKTEIQPGVQIRGSQIGDASRRGN